MLKEASYLLFLPQYHLNAIHRHHNADLLLFDVLGLEFILRADKNNTLEYYIRGRQTVQANISADFGLMAIFKIHNVATPTFDKNRD